MSMKSISEYDLAQWQSAAEREKLRVETRLFIGGDYVDAQEGGRFATVNPANGKRLRKCRPVPQRILIGQSQRRGAHFDPVSGPAWRRGTVSRCCIALPT